MVSFLVGAEVLVGLPTFEKVEPPGNQRVGAHHVLEAAFLIAGGLHDHGYRGHHVIGAVGVEGDGASKDDHGGTSGSRVGRTGAYCRVVVATEADGLIRGDDGITRCWWPGDHDDYRSYHDDEWGRPVVDDVHLFEKVCLEGFQAGLSWLTILRKREAFRVAFAGFEPEVVAGFTEADVVRCLGDAGIVRHRGKVESTINNAARALEVTAEFGSLAAYLWSFEPAVATRSGNGPGGIPASTRESAVLSRDLKRRGWSFVGPTTVYALMQAMGMVNDHLEGCALRPVVEAERIALVRPVPVADPIAGGTARP